MELTNQVTVALWIFTAVSALLCPFWIIYRPAEGGLFGVLVLFLLSGYFFLNGKSAFTEITGAVFAVGAFLLGALTALARIAQAAFRQSTGRSLDLDNVPPPLDGEAATLLEPQTTRGGTGWSTPPRR